MLLLVELPHDYPNTVPDLRIKNLSKQYLDNRMIDDYEQEIRKKAHESIGMQMIYELADHLKERISEINEKVLGQFEEIQRAKEEQEQIDAGPRTSNVDHLHYTPVNEETFSKWCEEFLSKLKQQEEANKTEMDQRPTGKELFMQMKGGNEFDDLTLDEEEAEMIVADQQELE